ncbi:outer membrane protein [Salinarimonas sp. NSM]|uniref:outer membrane protein n=1 Tax=Salinarimonas sp. NSM TaxID=3458003 RepID=UPI0040364E63
MPASTVPALLLIGRRRVAAAVVASALAVPALAPAHAADMGAADVGAADMGDLPPLPAIEPAPAAPVGSGWYLRGDIFHATLRDPDVTATNGAVAAFPGATVDGGVGFGLGAGYKANSWLRFDVTADHRGGLDAEIFSGTPVAGARGTSTFSSTALLANAYLDLGTWHGFTPYVGAGVGWAWNSLDGLTVSGCPAPCAVAGVSLAGLDRAHETTGSFAYALTAGVSVDAGRSLSLDLNYRYVHLGEAATGFVGGTRIAADALSAHEARIGLRWSFAEPAPETPHDSPLSRAF